MMVFFLLEKLNMYTVIRAENIYQKSFQDLLIQNTIKHDFSSPYFPHQNLTAEQNWCTLFDMTTSMLLESNLPISICGHILL